TVVENGGRWWVVVASGWRMAGFGGGCHGDSSSISFEQKILKLEEDNQLAEEEIAKIRREFGAAKQSFFKIPDALKGMQKMDPNGIYVNKNLRLENIQVYGFDYDYTLAYYSANLQSLIYELAKEHLVNELRYPDSCLEFKYDPTFPIRGLYYDKLKGCLLKLDFFGSIEPDGCYFGWRKFTKKEIEQIYGTRHIGRDQARGLVSLMDFFCFSEACLIADIVQHFVDAKLEFDAPYVYQDVNRAIQHVHRSGLAHRGILFDPQRYLVKDVRDDELCSNICIICFYCSRSPVLNSFSAATLSQDSKGKWEETFLVDQLSVLFCGWSDAFYVRGITLGFADPNSTLYSRVLNPREGSSMFTSGQVIPNLVKLVHTFISLCKSGPRDTDAVRGLQMAVFSRLLFLTLNHFSIQLITRTLI
ncbi:hypothetical protein LOK49_LG13G01953, partial [Camellia lanceoleosa]